MPTQFELLKASAIIPITNDLTAATAADRTQTGLDAQATASDRAAVEAAGVGQGIPVTLGEVASALGQVADQVNGGQAALKGGSLADPALRIGSVGIYSSATDTLSVAIAGVEVARFTATGLTIFGTVTEV